ncbi:MAG: acetyl-CoA carboxylase biotin carboxyl carrier protein [Flavobacteriaceae bacterium]|jgi:acetyl-CoA carboxylase biotin carboxyl carrier protein|nr:acetyl-CoA carboxylase biotin carboxyl carrier protein [Flavobacteriaceae bacterium]
MDIKEIQNLIKFVSKSDVAEVNLKLKDFEIKIKNIGGQTVTYAPQPVIPAQMPVAPQAAPAAPAPQAAEKPAAEDENSKYITVKSPMIGTFYRASGPGKDPFVSVGDTVSVGSVLCIVEAMKLFNEIESEVSGKVVKVLVDDATPIEYDQPLFLIDPS